MFPLKSINTSTYSNKQHQMSHSFHMPIQVLFVISQNTAALFFGVFFHACELLQTPFSQQQGAQSFICPLIGF